jgi:SAM-dependent methyltransferase
MSGRRAGQRFDADLGVTTEALIFLGSLDPEAVGPNLEYATHYEPTPVKETVALLERVPPPLEETTFVDIGSGMGRVVIVAARRPFKAVIGVEISPTLHEVARDNVASLAADKLRCHDIRLVCGDAARYRFPRRRLAVYMYNPFRAPVMEQMLERLLSYRRDLTLLYHTPAERGVIEKTGAFEIVEELPFAVIYRAALPRLRA